MSIAINDIQIERPDIDLEDYETGPEDNANDEPEAPIEEEPEEVETPDDTVTQGGSDSTTNINVEVPAQPASCSTAANRTAPLGIALALGLVAMGRRRND